jgi:hypothetical protein
VNVLRSDVANAEITEQLSPLMDLIQSTQEEEAALGAEGGAKGKKLNLPQVKQIQTQSPGTQNLTESIDVNQVSGGGGAQAGLKGGQGGGQAGGGAPFLETRQQTQTTERVPGLGLQPKTTTQITQRPAAPFIAETLLGMEANRSARIRADAAALRARVDANTEYTKRIDEAGKGIASARIFGGPAALQQLEDDIQSRFGKDAPVVMASARRQEAVIRRKAAEEIRLREISNRGAPQQAMLDAVAMADAIKRQGRKATQSEIAQVQTLLNQANREGQTISFTGDGFDLKIGPGGGRGGESRRFKLQQQLLVVGRLQRQLGEISQIAEKNPNLIGGPRMAEDFFAFIRGGASFGRRLLEEVPALGSVVDEGRELARSLSNQPDLEVPEDFKNEVLSEFMEPDFGRNSPSLVAGGPSRPTKSSSVSSICPRLRALRSWAEPSRRSTKLTLKRGKSLLRC